MTDLYENDGVRQYEAPILAPVVDTDSDVTPEAGADSRDGPGPHAAGRDRRRRWLVAIGGVLVVAAMAAIGFYLFSTLRQLDAARGDIESLEGDVASMQRSAVAAARDAAETEAAKNEAISSLEDQLSATEADLVATETELAGSQDDVGRLELDVTNLAGSLDDARSTIGRARGQAATLASLVSLRLALNTWATPQEMIRELESSSIDLSGYDAALRALGIAETWDAWSGTAFFSAVWVMEDFVDDIDDTELTGHWEEWVHCSTDRSCTQAYMELDATLVQAINETMASTREPLGDASAEF